jgi:hypothetical protein
MIPLALFWLQERMHRLRGGRTDLRLWLSLATIAMVAGGIFLFGSIKPDLDYRNCPDFCYLWAGIHLGLTVGAILLAIRTGRIQNLSSKPKATAL